MANICMNWLTKLETSLGHRSEHRTIKMPGTCCWRKGKSKWPDWLYLTTLTIINLAFYSSGSGVAWRSRFERYLLIEGRCSVWNACRSSVGWQYIRSSLWVLSYLPCHTAFLSSWSWLRWGHSISPQKPWPEVWKGTVRWLYWFFLHWFPFLFLCTLSTKPSFQSFSSK